MATDLRAYHEKALGYTLEGAWSDAIKLVHRVSEEEIDEQNVTGQVLWDTTDEDPATGAEIVMDRPIATMRLSSLTTVPRDGETWAVWIPRSNTDDTPTLHMFERVGRHGSIGMLRLYLTRPTQEDLV